MKKLTMLLPAMIAVALPLQASADVKWGGRLQVEFASTDDNTAAESGLQMGDTYYNGGNASYLGATFSDGDAFGKINLNFNHYKGESSPGLRDLYIGTKVGPGKLMMGSFSTAYKTAGGVKYDPFVATGLQARGNGGQSGAGQNSYITAVGYSAKMAGVKVNVNYLPAMNSTAGVEADAQMSASVTYGFGGGEVFFATDDKARGAHTGSKVGGKYAMGETSLRVQYEMADTDTDADILFVGAEHKLAGMTVGGWYGMSTTGTADAISSLAVGVKKSMGKKTSAYAGFKSEGAAGDGDAQTALVVGMRTGF
jgi:hypothetical protein